jgi:hypothetical protein
MNKGHDGMTDWGLSHVAGAMQPCEAATVSRRGTCDRGIWRKPLMLRRTRRAINIIYSMGFQWPFRYFIA